MRRAPAQLIATVLPIVITFDHVAPGLMPLPCNTTSASSAAIEIGLIPLEQPGALARFRRTSPPHPAAVAPYTG